MIQIKHLMKSWKMNQALKRLQRSAWSRWIFHLVQMCELLTLLYVRMRRHWNPWWFFRVVQQRKHMNWLMMASFWQSRWQKRLVLVREILCQSQAVKMHQSQQLSHMLWKIIWCIMFIWQKAVMKKCSRLNQNITCIG